MEPLDYQRKTWSFPTHCITVSSCFLLFLMSVFPMIYKLLYAKWFVFALVLASVLLEYITTSHSRLDFRIILWTVGLSAMSFLFVMEGWFRQTPGATKMAGLYVVWPMVYIIWVAGLAQQRLLAAIDVTLCFATLFIGVFGCAYMLTQLGILPDTSVVSFLSMDWDSNVFVGEAGYTSMTFAGVSSLPFLLPYVLARLVTRVRGEKQSRLARVVLWGASILALAVTLATSRRVLILILVLTPLLTLILRSFQQEEERKLSRRSFTAFTLGLLAAIFLVLVGLNAAYKFDLASVWERFSSGFDIRALSSDVSGGATARHEQFVALMRGWLQQPLLGAGHGATASSYGSIRSYTAPWSYELGYVALLFQIGLVGFTAYAAGVIWIFARGIKLIRERGQQGRMMLAMLVGFAGALVAHAADPYLDRFDSFWMLFLPVAVINYWSPSITFARNSRNLNVSTGQMV